MIATSAGTRTPRLSSSRINPRRGVVLVADDAVGGLRQDAVGQLGVRVLGGDAPRLLEHEGTAALARPVQRGEVAGQAALVAAGGRPGEEGDPSTALVQQVLGASQPAVEVVGRDEVIFERARQAAEVALDQDDGDPRLAARPEERLVLPGGLVLVAARA